MTTTRSSGLALTGLLRQARRAVFTVLAVTASMERPVSLGVNVRFLFMLLLSFRNLVKIPSVIEWFD
jgi:hypothetical protein